MSHLYAISTSFSMKKMHKTRIFEESRWLRVITLRFLRYIYVYINGGCLCILEKIIKHTAITNNYNLKTLKYFMAFCSLSIFLYIFKYLKTL